MCSVLAISSPPENHHLYPFPGHLTKPNLWGPRCVTKHATRMQSAGYRIKHYMCACLPECWTPMVCSFCLMKSDILIEFWHRKGAFVYARIPWLQVVYNE